MPTCFVIQPFDAGKFDKRYEQVFKPAIIAADLDPYRVDKDHSADVLIDAIEDGIRNAHACLADISTDNPNVWFELGYALALNKTVVMVCAKGAREKFPFDIQHRKVVSYDVDAPDDFRQLKDSIITRLRTANQSKSLLEKAEEERGEVSPIGGLSPHELIVMGVLIGEVGDPDNLVHPDSIQREAYRAGLTPVGYTMALRKLQTKSFLKKDSAQDNNGYEYPVMGVSETGWKWVDENEQLFVLQKPNDAIKDDDIPF